MAATHSTGTIDTAELSALRSMVGRSTSPAWPGLYHPAKPTVAAPARPMQFMRTLPWPRNGQFHVRQSGNRSFEYQLVKRALDIVGALVAIVLFSPIMLATFLTLMVTTRGKPLFFQERVGLGGRRFRMCKFRTMCDDADAKQHLVRNEKDGPIFKNRQDPRITRLGRFLRSTSIDELPQLFSILLGDMALVGPRPPVPKEVAKYELWQRERLSVKPGLTCLWQVSGRSEIGFADWVRMDIWYVRNQGLWTDLKLLWATPKSVLSRRGAY